MSGANPLMSPGGNPLMPTRAAPQPVAPAAPAPTQFPPFGLHHARAALANVDQASMIKKRDSIGPEMDKLAQIANNPEDNNRADIAAYIGKLTRTGQVTPEEAAMILQGLPEDQTGIRAWARHMFNAVMQAGIHAHAAYPRSLFPSESNGQGPAAPEPAAEPSEGADNE